MADDTKPADDAAPPIDLAAANEIGYLGTVPDQPPNEAYTVAGVTSSDEAAQADRRAAAGQLNVAPDPTAEPAPAPKSSAKKSSE